MNQENEPMNEPVALSQNIQVDNIEAAMEKVSKAIKPTMPQVIREEDDAPADKQILIRINDSDRERWKLAADKMDISMSAFIRETVNAQVSNILDCSHPINLRRYYPWAEFCLKCNMRLRG